MLKGKVALVTGASRGIGRAIALDLAAQGADISVNYAGNEEAAHRVAFEIRAMGRNALVIQGDVGQSTDFDELIKQTEAELGPIDILVNNAGITRDNLLMRMKEDEFDQVIETNLKGVFNGIKAVSRPMMKRRSGVIINISSVVGALGNGGQSNYAAAKAGVIGLTKSAARELAARGIRVNAVAPGFVSTDMTDKLSQEMTQKLMEQIPLARFGKPEDIAKVVTFLATDAASYMTGQTIHVDGGMYMST